MTHLDMFIDYKCKLKMLNKKLREKGKHGLALKIVNKYNLKQVSESYYD